MNIVSYRLPTTTPNPTKHNDCGWVAIVDGVEVGWITMTFKPDNSIRFEDAFVHPDHRGKGIYRKLWDTRWEYVTANFKGMKIHAYCKPPSVNLYKEKEFTFVENVVLVEKIA